MFRLLIRFSALATLLQGARTTPTLANTSDPVCVIGAGPGGLTIAHELEAKGYSTVVFEKQAAVGGKCQSFYDGPDKSIYHPLGALIFTNQTWVNTLPLIEASGLQLSPGPDVSGAILYGPGSAASTVVPSPPITEAQKSQLASEFQKYTAFWTAQFAPNYTSPRYVNGVPDEFAVPMGQWLKSQGFQAIPKVMEIGMVPYGYGDINQTPALYMLQYFTPDVLGAFLGSVTSYNVDFHQVMVHYASSLKGRIYLNSPVVAVERSGDRPIVTFADGATVPATQRCAKVVFAFPPTLENLHAISMPLSVQESRVFSRVGITAYWASAVETKVDFPQPYIQMPFQPLAAPVSFLRIFNGSQVATAWSWGVTDSNPPLDVVKDLLVDTISQVQLGLRLNSVIDKSAVKAIRKWDYFPHFGSSDLREGIYAEYNALQGLGNSYFSSGLNGFELVEFTIRAGKDLVHTFF